jgi:hypothetical protein
LLTVITKEEVFQGIARIFDCTYTSKKQLSYGIDIAVDFRYPAKAITYAIVAGMLDS